MNAGKNRPTYKPCCHLRYEIVTTDRCSGSPYHRCQPRIGRCTARRGKTVPARCIYLYTQYFHLRTLTVARAWQQPRQSWAAAFVASLAPFLFSDQNLTNSKLCLLVL